MKLHTDRPLFANAIQVTSQVMGMAPEFVEKDYWICQILQRLSRHSLNERIVWKGGTSLSKAYGLIKRFSSDIDFAILLEGLSQNQQKKLIAKIGKETTVDLKELDLPELTEKSSRFRKTYHGYESVVNGRNNALKFLGSHVIVEINTFGNPYPYVRRSIKPFITEMMQRQGMDSMIELQDMLPFDLNVLDKRRTLCEKVVSLIRFSFEKDPIIGIASKIRHFYDLYYLMKDKECKEYLKTKFSFDLINLIDHDRAEFDRPPQWKTTAITSSPLLCDFNSIWGKLSAVYQTEVGALAYETIPTSDEIKESLSLLFSEVNHVISHRNSDGKLF